MKLTFGAADGDTDIWLNGKHIGTHNYPYKGDPDSWKKPFDVDTCGNMKDGENLLVVRVDKKQNGLSGLWRPVFLSIGSIQAENLSAAGWIINTPAGRFSIDKKDYPLTIKAIEADTTKLNIYKGVWGRLYRTEAFTAGQQYMLQCTYRTLPECKGTFQIWVRSSKGKALDKGNINFSAPQTDGEWRTVKFRFQPEKDSGAIYLTMINGVGDVQIRELTIAPMAEIASEAEKTESLPAAGWKPHTQAGRFVYQSKVYPLNIKAEEADAAKPNAFKGVWGRLYRVEAIKPNQNYKVRCTYKTLPDCKGQFSLWIRSANGDNPKANLNFNAPFTNGEWRTVDVPFTPEKDSCALYLTLANDTGEIQIRDIAIFSAE